MNLTQEEANAISAGVFSAISYWLGYGVCALQWRAYRKHVVRILEELRESINSL